MKLNHQKMTRQKYTLNFNKQENFKALHNSDHCVTLVNTNPIII